MNLFTLLTVVGALGVVVLFLAGCRGRENPDANLRGAEERRKLFGLAVALTILSALLAHD